MKIWLPIGKTAAVRQQMKYPQILNVSKVSVICRIL